MYGEPAGGVPAVIVGAVLSMLIPLAVAVALVFPALSVQEPAADRPSPSLLSTEGVVQEAIPERESVPAKVTVTSELFQPLLLAAGAGVAVAVGGVVSMLIP